MSGEQQQQQQQQGGAPAAPQQQQQPQRQSGGRRTMNDFDEKRCMRIGVGRGRRQLVEEDVMFEIDSTKMCPKVDAVFIEPEDPNGRYSWARVYFLTNEDADICATEMNSPGRATRWRQFVTQRLPLPGPFSGEVGTEPMFEAFVQEPADTIVVDTQEGFVGFSTDELYRTRGAEDCMQAKSVGKSIRRLICKHFDPVKRINCRFGTSCTFVHVKADAMLKMIRTVSHRQSLRFPKHEEDIQQSGYEFDRRSDTLIVRDLESGVGEPELRYMFEGCAGFITATVRRMRDSDKRYGVVRFEGRDNATAALAQTFDEPSINVCFFGTMEDLRSLQMRDVKATGQYPQQHHQQHQQYPPRHQPQQAPPPRGEYPSNQGSGPASGFKRPRSDDRDQQQQSAPPRPKDESSKAPQSGAGESSSPSSKLPFPSLPEGWDYGISRRTKQYYFFEKGKKTQTTWRHPVTNDSYNS